MLCRHGTYKSAARLQTLPVVQDRRCKSRSQLQMLRQQKRVTHRDIGSGEPVRNQVVMLAEQRFQGPQACQEPLGVELIS